VGTTLVIVSVSLMIIMVIWAVFILARRHHRLRTETPKDRYQRDIRDVQMETYRQTKPRPAGQLGNPEGDYGNFGGSGV
jgi:hypothetical protein